MAPTSSRIKIFNEVSEGLHTQNKSWYSCAPSVRFDVCIWTVFTHIRIQDVQESTNSLFNAKLKSNWALYLLYTNVQSVGKYTEKRIILNKTKLGHTVIQYRPGIWTCLHCSKPWDLQSHPDNCPYLSLQHRSCCHEWIFQIPIWRRWVYLSYNIIFQ